MAALEFANYKQANKTIELTIQFLNKVEPARPLFMQKAYPMEKGINKTTINFDVEFGLRNVMGVFASPNSDVQSVALQNFSSVETYFSYAKEFVTDADDIDENLADERQFAGQNFAVNFTSNYAYRVREKFARALQRFENLHELVATYNQLYGGYSSRSDYHPEIVYFWSRSCATLAAELKGDNALKLIPSVNLTTTAVTAPWNSSFTIMPVVATDGGVSYTAGEKIWNKTNIDAGTATPYKDIVKMVQTCKDYGVPADIVMSSDCAEWLDYDIRTKYPDASNLNLLVTQSIQQKILPTLENIDGIQLERVLSISESGPTNGGISIPVYTNNSVYHDRSTGSQVRYFPAGFVAVRPTQASLFQAYGRIKHKRANFAAMPYWMNHWQDEKSAIENWEWHRSFVMGASKPNSLVTWKVR